MKKFRPKHLRKIKPGEIWMLKIPCNVTSKFLIIERPNCDFTIPSILVYNLEKKEKGVLYSIFEPNMESMWMKISSP